MKYDICIIGGGFGGLICARQLAKAGRSVLLLERHDVLHVLVAEGFAESNGL